MTYEGLIGDIFPAEYGALCQVCSINPAVGTVCPSCAGAICTLGDKLNARLTRRFQRARGRSSKKGGA